MVKEFVVLLCFMAKVMHCHCISNLVSEIIHFRESKKGGNVEQKALRL